MTDSEEKVAEAVPDPSHSEQPVGAESPQPAGKMANSDTSAESPSTPESPAASPGGDASDDKPPKHDSNRSSEKRTVYFNQYFNGTVQASGSRFGVSDPSATPGPLTGKLNNSDIEDLALGYVRPKAFSNAFEALQRAHAIVLEGPSGIGKRAGATMLLRELASGPLIALPPTMSAKQLATYDYEVGRGYLVTDSEHTGRRADSEHEWHAVRDQVCDGGAWLVVTGPVTTGRDSEFVPRVGWQRPDTRAVLRAWLGSSDITDAEFDVKIAEIESWVPSEFAFADLRQIVVLSGDGAEPMVLSEVFDEGAHQRVIEWFDTVGQASRRNLLTVTVAAFLGRCGQRTFESCLIELEQRFAHTEAKSDDKPESSSQRADSSPQRVDTIPELRSAMLDDKALLHLSVESGITPRSFVDFRESRYREHVIAELWLRMDVAFWNTVRDWLCHTLSGSPEGDATLHERTIAEALLMLASISFDEVADAYLEPWSRGEHGFACRDMAIFLLWDMCAGTVLAPAALQIAVRWAESGTALQKWTAAFALSGVLGVRYPEEATRQLWRLIVRSGNQDAVERCQVMAELFARLATRSPQADTVLVFLESKHRDARLGPRSRLLVECAIAETLAVQDGVTERSAVFGHLNNTPGGLEPVVRLWAITLRGSVFRKGALDALLDGLRDLTEICTEPEQTARALAAEFTRILPTRERRMLAHNLAFRHRQRIAVVSKRRAIRHTTVSAKVAQREVRVAELVRIMLTLLTIDHVD
ncbi:hypothetical protein [Nocardia sp. NPDC050175]|uniref:hypothetical protein n=1 Tax=Nocardia sp. NPDC050175 TaxID=3364317 RepID=UPI0037B819A1